MERYIDDERANKIVAALKAANARVEVGPFGGLPGFNGSFDVPFPDGSELSFTDWGRDGLNGSLRGGNESEAARFIIASEVTLPLSEEEIKLIGEVATEFAALYPCSYGWSSLSSQAIEAIRADQRVRPLLCRITRHDLSDYFSFIPPNAGPEFRGANLFLDDISDQRCLPAMDQKESVLGQATERGELKERTYPNLPDGVIPSNIVRVHRNT